MDDKKKNRRVSFASQARVRLFEMAKKKNDNEDEDFSDDEKQIPKPTTDFDDDDGEELQKLISTSTGKLSMPDFSSVHQVDNDSSFSENNSFNVDVKGDAMDSSSPSLNSPLPHSPAKQLLITNPSLSSPMLEHRRSPRLSPFTKSPLPPSLSSLANLANSPRNKNFMFSPKSPMTKSKIPTLSPRSSPRLRTKSPTISRTNNNVTKSPGKSPFTQRLLDSKKKSVMNSVNSPGELNSSPHFNPPFQLIQPGDHTTITAMSNLTGGKKIGKSPFDLPVQQHEDEYGDDMSIDENFEDTFSGKRPNTSNNINVNNGNGNSNGGVGSGANKSRQSRQSIAPFFDNLGTGMMPLPDTDDMSVVLRNGKIVVPGVENSPVVGNVPNLRGGSGGGGKFKGRESIATFFKDVGGDAGDGVLPDSEDMSVVVENGKVVAKGGDGVETPTRRRSARLSSGGTPKGSIVNSPSVGKVGERDSENRGPMTRRKSIRQSIGTFFRDIGDVEVSLPDPDEISVVVKDGKIVAQQDTSMDSMDIMTDVTSSIQQHPKSRNSISGFFKNLSDDEPTKSLPIQSVQSIQRQDEESMEIDDDEPSKLVNEVLPFEEDQSSIFEQQIPVSNLYPDLPEDIDPETTVESIEIAFLQHESQFGDLLNETVPKLPSMEIEHNVNNNNEEDNSNNDGDDDDEGRQPNKQYKLSTFLEETGVQFQDDFSVEVKRREVFEEETDELVVTSAYLYTPMVQWMRVKNAELYQNIVNIKMEVEKAEEECESAEPLVFYEYASANYREKEVFKRKIKATELQIRALINANLYGFKAEVNEQLLAELEKGVQQVAETVQALKELQERVDAYVEKIAGLQEEAKRKEAERQMSKEQRDNAKRERIAMLKEKIIEKQAELEAQKKRQETFNNLKIENEMKKTELIAKKDALLESIERNKEIQNQHRVTEPETFRENKEQLQFAFALYGWIPQKMCGEYCSYVFDSIFRVRFDIGAESMNVTVAYVNKNAHCGVYNKPNENDEKYACIEAFGSENILSWLQPKVTISKSIDGMKSVFNRISVQWETLKDLYRDIQEARFVCPVNITQGDSDKEKNRVCVVAKFMEMKREGGPQRFIVNFVVDEEFWGKYKVGGFEWTFVQSLGKVEKSKVAGIIESTKSGVGWLSRVCRQLKQFNRSG